MVFFLLRRYKSTNVIPFLRKNFKKKDLYLVFPDLKSDNHITNFSGTHLIYTLIITNLNGKIYHICSVGLKYSKLWKEKFIIFYVVHDEKTLTSYFSTYIYTCCYVIELLLSYATYQRTIISNLFMSPKRS